MEESNIFSLWFLHFPFYQVYSLVFCSDWYFPLFLCASRHIKIKDKDNLLGEKKKKKGKFCNAKMNHWSSKEWTLFPKWILGVLKNEPYSLIAAPQDFEHITRDSAIWTPVLVVSSLLKRTFQQRCKALDPNSTRPAAPLLLHRERLVQPLAKAEIFATFCRWISFLLLVTFQSRFTRQVTTDF